MERGLVLLSKGKRSDGLLEALMEGLVGLKEKGLGMRKGEDLEGMRNGEEGFVGLKDMREEGFVAVKVILARVRAAMTVSSLTLLQ